MKKSCFVLLVAGLVISFGAQVSAEAVSDEVRIAKLVLEMTEMPAEQLSSLDPLPVRRFELPPPGVDVMRARLTETYTVEGIGEDTVELTGWIAVKHYDTRPVQAGSDISWDTAVTSTQFVGMGLTGQSELFGRVEVGLTGQQPIGEVGRIELPEQAMSILLAQATGTETEPQTETEPGDPTILCEAQVNVAVRMLDLGLEMATAEPVLWYSSVDTIPPVGTTASVTVEPVSLLIDGREVGKLVSGKVDFREVVRHVPLMDAKSYGNDEIAAVGE